MNKRAKISALSLSILLLGAGAVQLAAADEHGRPEAARTERDRAQSRPAAGRAGVDGRGQVLDSRYNHGRYYPAFGSVRPSLPEGYRPYYRGGSRFYFSGGIWYAPSGPGFVVVRPPAGLVISVLPPYYSTVWFGGVPYYYADNVYYSWQPDQNGYAVVDPPENADTPSPPPDTRTGAAGSDHLSEERPVEGPAGGRPIRVPYLGQGPNWLDPTPAGRRAARRRARSCDVSLFQAREVN